MSERKSVLGFKHLKILLFSAIVLSASILSTITILRLQGTMTENTETKAGENHFSVVWRGFIPDYDPSYPDYYICINELIGDTLTMNIKLFIQSQEANGYYFKIKQCDTGPPSGWFVPEYLIGYIDIDETKTFVYQMERTKPTVIPEGRITETVCLNVTAYYDATYTSVYSWDSFNVTFHFLDRKDNYWTVIYNNNFDDATAQGWSGGGPSPDYYRSFRYSLRGYNLYKSFYTGAEYNESYIIFAVRFYLTTTDYPRIYLDGTEYFRPDTTPTRDIWYQFAVPLHLGTTEIRIQQASSGYYMYMDDVYVIAHKP